MSDVLGIKNLMIDQSSQKKDAKSSYVILVLVEDFMGYNAEEKDLLNKMLAALKMDLTLFKVLDSIEEHSNDFKFEIQFLDEVPNQEIPKNKIITHSPRVLLSEPKLKKQAWDQLQKVIYFYQNN